MMMSSSWNLPQFLEELKDLLNQVKDSDILELSWEKDEHGFKFRRKKGGVFQPQIKEIKSEAEKESIQPSFKVQSPVVGIFHFPDKKPEIGSFILEGKELGSITSINVVYPIEIEKSGRLAEIHAVEGEPVDFGKLLFTLEF